MTLFDPNSSLLAGRSTAQLQTDLNNAQQAYIDLSSGAKAVSLSYTQGDGSKTVTYTPADIGALSALIRTLQLQLGIIPRGRKPLRFNF